MYIELKNINKSFGDFKASDNVSFGIEKGKLIGLLGPSGSGKTTILRMLAGLEKQDSGDIIIDGKNVNKLPSNERGIGFVFQSYALFPFMTVYDNIAYGLKVQKKDKKFIKQRVAELLELVGLPDVGKRYPDQLSGGQRQRIALARALAPQPELLLLDEPFAAIDAKVRKELRTWLRDTIDKIGITSIFVTHDQDEAIEVADEIVITNKGRVEQIGNPVEIYLEPKTPFVAQFIGQSAVIEDYSKLKGFETAEGKTSAIIRPEFIEINKFEDSEYHQFESSMEDAVVEEVSFRGNSFEVKASIDGISVTGMKAWGSEKAGSCIAATAEKGDMSVCVVLNGCDSQEDMNAEAKKLLNLAFDTYEIYTPELPEDMVKETVVCGGEELSVELAPEGLYPIVIPRGTYRMVECDFTAEEKLDAPVKNGEIAGEIRYTMGGEVILEGKIVACKEVKKMNFICGIKKLVYNLLSM